MAVLIKIKSASLMESLVASIIIIIIFMVASISLNNLFENRFKTDRQNLKAHISELNYLKRNNKLEFPYVEENQNWSISILKTLNGSRMKVFDKKLQKSFEIEY